MPPPPRKPRATLSSGSPRSPGSCGKISCVVGVHHVHGGLVPAVEQLSAPTTPSAASSIFVRPSGTVTPIEQLQSMMMRHAMAAALLLAHLQRHRQHVFDRDCR